MEGDSILKELEPLFEKAEKEKLWFYTHYQEMWFSPKELRAHHSKGVFIWGAVNWILRNPEEYGTILKNRVIDAQKELLNFEKRMAG